MTPKAKALTSYLHFETSTKLGYNSICSRMCHMNRKHNGESRNVRLYLILSSTNFSYVNCLWSLPYIFLNVRERIILFSICFEIGKVTNNTIRTYFGTSANIGLSSHRLKLTNVNRLIVLDLLMFQKRPQRC